jgi:hypothetical protein
MSYPACPRRRQRPLEILPVGGGAGLLVAEHQAGELPARLGADVGEESRVLGLQAERLMVLVGGDADVDGHAQRPGRVAEVQPGRGPDRAALGDLGGSGSTGGALARWGSTCHELPL